MNQLKTKIVSLSEAQSIVKKWKEVGEQVVFTNGCFDILHRGHVEYLTLSADEGSKLVIGLNSDASVRRQGKSPERPINDEISRGIVLAALAVVDLVVIFDENTPLDLIVALQPNVLTKGADYDPKETDVNSKKYIVGSDVITKSGGKVIAIPLVQGFSTTNTIKKISGDQS
ncbi:MAG: adenylyltransferase/cytidyltransferase family protein [Bacteroidota bacterium]